MAFDTNVFVNCPFDDDYLPLLRPLLFTILYLGFTPKIALETLELGRNAHSKNNLSDRAIQIRDPRYFAPKSGEGWRLLPAEYAFRTGFGCRMQTVQRGPTHQEKMSYPGGRKVQISSRDLRLSNSDIAVHKNEPADITSEVRNWLNNMAKLKADGPSKIWWSFNDFMADKDDELRLRGFSDEDIENLPIAELIRSMRDWFGTR